MIISANGRVILHPGVTFKKQKIREYRGPTIRWKTQQAGTDFSLLISIPASIIIKLQDKTNSELSSFYRLSIPL